MLQERKSTINYEKLKALRKSKTDNKNWKSI